GANNLCRGCDPNFNIYDEAKIFEQQLSAVIQELSDVPRLFVNLVSIFNISQVFEVSEKELYCRGVHDILGFLEVHPDPIGSLDFADPLRFQTFSATVSSLSEAANLRYDFPYMPQIFSELTLT